MHLTMEELLDVRDGEARPEATSHAASCPACAAEVERLREMAAALRSLPVVEPERDQWPRVRSALEIRRRRRRVLAVGAAALAMAASLVVVLLIPGPEPEPIPVLEPREIDVTDLVLESRRLEEVLRAVGPEGRVMDVWQASTVADLEDEIGLIDLRLARPAARNVPPEEVARLWRKRVDLMNELVRVRGGQIVYVGL